MPAAHTNRVVLTPVCLPLTHPLGWDRKKRWKGWGPLVYSMDKTDWLQVSKGMRQSWILSPYLFSFYAEYILWEVGMENVFGFKTGERDINNLC